MCVWYLAIDCVVVRFWKNKQKPTEKKEKIHVNACLVIWKLNYYNVHSSIDFTSSDPLHDIIYVVFGAHDSPYQ